MCELTNEYISDKEIMQIYFISISTQVNELYNLFHYMMNVYEFMEGLARLAERLSPCIERNKSQFDKRLGPLDSKLILMIYILYQRLKWEIRKIYHRKGLIFRDFERRIYNDIIRRQMLIGKTKEDLEAERKKEIEMKKRKLLNKPFHSRSVDTIQRRVTLRKNDKRMVFSLHQLLG